MFYLEYLAVKAKAEQPRKLLARRFQKRVTRDATLYIRDLILQTSTNASHGEAGQHTNEYTTDPMERLLDFIKFIAELTNNIHRQSNYDKQDDGHYCLKVGRRNHITRALLHEFMLYTHTPLGQAELERLIDGIIQIAENQCDNVHLLLSSIALLGEEGKVLNVVLYVQCGAEPQVEIIAKTIPHHADHHFARLSNYCQTACYVDAQAQLPTSTKGFIVPNRSVFKVTTWSGAQYTQAVDICFDHVLGRSRKQFEEILCADDDDAMPMQVDHVLTSNSLCQTRSSKTYAALAEPVVQADPLNDHQVPYSTILKIEDSVLPDVDKEKYPSMRLRKGDKYLYIMRPSFGSAVTCQLHPNRKLCTFDETLGSLQKKAPVAAPTAASPRHDAYFYLEGNRLIYKDRIQAFQLNMSGILAKNKSLHLSLFTLFGIDTRYQFYRALKHIFVASNAQFQHIKTHMKNTGDFLMHADLMFRDLLCQLNHIDVMPQTSKLFLHILTTVKDEHAFFISQMSEFLKNSQTEGQPDIRARCYSSA